MTILILEDEPLVAEQLMGYVRQLVPHATLVGPLASVQEAWAWFRKHPEPDLILADVQLSDGISIDLLVALKPASPVIFTTAFDQYAIRAFKVNSVDYLLKPIQYDELQTALVKFRDLRQQGGGRLSLEELARFLEGKPVPARYKENFILYSGQQAQRIEEKDIACFIKRDLIFLQTIDQRVLVTEYRSLDEVEELVDPTCYFRVNRQLLVHRRIIGGYKTDLQGKLLLTLKTGVQETPTVSKEKAAVFKRWFET
jgi:two-component system, LytTR family, response regulator